MHELGQREQRAAILTGRLGVLSLHISCQEDDFRQAALAFLLPAFTENSNGTSSGAAACAPNDR